MDDELNKQLNKELLPRGAPFREQYGISGRTFSLLGAGLKRFLMAYFLLYSIPGSVAMVYGDEFGVKNIPLNQLPEHERNDSRNINRGTLTKQQMHTERSKHIGALIEEMLNKRQILRHYQNIRPERWDRVKDSSVFAAVYRLGMSELVVIINLSDKKKSVSYNCDEYKCVVSVNSVQVKKDGVVLGPYGGVWLEK